MHDTLDEESMDIPWTDYGSERADHRLSMVSQGSYRSGKSWKSQGNLIWVREKWQSESLSTFLISVPHFYISFCMTCCDIKWVRENLKFLDWKSGKSGMTPVSAQADWAWFDHGHTMDLNGLSMIRPWAVSRPDLYVLPKGGPWMDPVGFALANLVSWPLNFWLR